MAFDSIYDTDDGSGPQEITDVKEMDSDELLQGFIHGSEEHLMEWLRRFRNNIPDPGMEAVEDV